MNEKKIALRKYTFNIGSRIPEWWQARQHTTTLTPLEPLATPSVLLPQQEQIIAYSYLCSRASRLVFTQL
jgi:hypothetical protein